MTNHVRNYKESLRKYPKNGKKNRICHILHRTCLLKHSTEGKIKGSIYVMKDELRKREDTLN